MGQYGVGRTANSGALRRQIHAHANPSGSYGIRSTGRSRVGPKPQNKSVSPGSGCAKPRSRVYRGLRCTRYLGLRVFQRNAYVLRETFSSAKSCFARFVACGPRSLKTLPIAYAEAKIQKRRGDGLTQGARSPRLNLDRLRQSRQRCRRVTGRGAKRLRTGGTGGRATSALESDATTVRPMELAGWSLKGSGGLISNVRVGFAPRLGRAPLEGCGGLCSKVRAGFIRRFERAFLEGSGGPHSEVRAGFTQRFGRAPLESGGGLYCNVRAGFTRRFARALLASSELKPKVQALSRRFRI